MILQGHDTPTHEAPTKGKPGEKKTTTRTHTPHKAHKATHAPRKAHTDKHKGSHKSAPLGERPVTVDTETPWPMVGYA